MKRIKPPTDIQQKQGLERSKKLYLSTTEQAKRLDDARSCARTISDLFTPNILIQRRKFCDYCEKLIFLEPLFYGKKGEELLWRKGYYDVVSTAKKLKKKDYSPDEISFLITHIHSGIGFYHHFLSKLQIQFSLNLKNVVDFHLEVNTDDVAPSSDHQEWAKLAVHQCLIYLGDLSRYKLDIELNTTSNLAFRYYLQAINFKPEIGMPHNQMGYLAMNQNKFLDAVYHYMRCLSCTVPFEGTNNNLQSLFEKNTKFIEQLPSPEPETAADKPRAELIRNLISRFLHLIEIWYYNKDLNKVYNLCHQTYKDLEEALAPPKALSDNCESPVNEETDQSRLSADNIFKLVSICLLCINKMQKSNSQQVSTAVAFTLAIYSQLLQNLAGHIQVSVLNYPLPEGEPEINTVITDLLRSKTRKRRAKPKMRRKQINLDNSDSEVSEDDTEHQNGTVLAEQEPSSDEDDISDPDDMLAASSDEELDSDQKGANNKLTNKELQDQLELIKRVIRMDVNDMLEIITEESSLQSIKILNDWLTSDVDIIKSCGTNTRVLLSQITNLLNLININLKSRKLRGCGLLVDDIVKDEMKMPLSEDISLRGVEILASSHKDIDWNFFKERSLSGKEETMVRIVKIVSFGIFLTTIEETGVVFDESKKIFVCKQEVELENKGTNAVTTDETAVERLAENGATVADKEESVVKELGNGNKNQLMKMKHMGQLWLASEVKALENRVKGKTSLSPYLVLDTDALIKYTFMVKHLVHSRKFIVLIPSAVVSALDDLKRKQSEAREAIRWLESQFHHGNRFFRAQRPQERAPIPFIKYPKKRDKEMLTYIEIIECCYYLAEQQKGASNLVTLLIGNQNVLSNGENKDFSYVGLAQSAGITIESITQFYGKWKKNYKGKR